MYYYPQMTYSNPTPRRPRKLFFAGVFMTLMGMMILVGVCIYTLFGLYNTSNLEELNTSIQGPVALPKLPVSQAQVRGDLLPDGKFKTIQVIKEVQTIVKEDSSVQYAPAPKRTAPGANSAPITQDAGTPSQAAETVKATFASSDPNIRKAPAPEQSETVGEADTRELVAVYNSIYPGHKIHPKYWDRPLTAGADEYTYGVIRRDDGFLEVPASNGLPKGTLSDATHLRIPSIGVDSEITNLAILDLGDSRKYETPAHVVGRIPQTSNPGELGNTWLFGHLESPIRGEGNVFKRLPDIPGILNNGDPVYVTLLNAEGEEFMYQITETEVVYKDDLALYDTDDSTITLVACVPRLVYDHRIVVTGKLVGIRKPA